MIEIFKSDIQVEIQTGEFKGLKGKILKREGVDYLVKLEDGTEKYICEVNLKKRE